MSITNKTNIDKLSHQDNKNNLPDDFFKSSTNKNNITNTKNIIQNNKKPSKHNTNNTTTNNNSTSSNILNSSSNIPAGFFDDPEKELEVRKIKLTKDIKLEIKINEIKEKEQKLLEEKQLQQFEEMLIPVREAEEEMIQK